MKGTLASFLPSFSSRFIFLKLGSMATVLAAVVFVADQSSKMIAFGSDRMSDTTIIPWLFGFMHHKNYGIVANIPIPIWVIVSATVCVILLVLYSMYQSIKSRKVIHVIAFSLILAGAFGNLYDRMTLGFVRDWILLFNRSVINVADISIFIGIILLLGNGHKMKVRDLEEKVSSK